MRAAYAPRTPAAGVSDFGRSAKDGCSHGTAGAPSRLVARAWLASVTTDQNARLKPAKKCMNLPGKWVSLRSDDIGKLEQELAHEVCKGHPLYQARVKALFRQYPFDDVLFQVVGLEHSFCHVHLTWRKETSPNWPSTVWFNSIEDFCQNYQVVEQIDENDPRWISERWRFPN